MNIVQYDFQGYQVSSDNDGWINATDTASHFNKEPTQWLRTEETLNYLFALQEALNINSVSEININKIRELD